MYLPLLLVFDTTNLTDPFFSFHPIYLKYYYIGINMIIADPQLLRFKSTQYLVGEGFHFGSTSALECDEGADTLDTLIVGSLLYIKKASFNESVPVWQRRT